MLWSSNGGASYPGTGSTGDGYHMAQEALGHTIVPLKPSLVPLECEMDYISTLQGLSLRNACFYRLKMKFWDMNLAKCCLLILAFQVLLYFL